MNALSSPVGFDPGRLEELAERCEKATGPDREIDCLIFEQKFPELTPSMRGMYYGEPTGAYFRDGGETTFRAPSYTASLDAAMSLVPEGHDMQINLYWGRDGEGSASVSPLKQLNLPRVFAATPAFALCAAALRARAALIPPSEPTEK